MNPYTYDPHYYYGYNPYGYDNYNAYYGNYGVAAAVIPAAAVELNVQQPRPKILVNPNFKAPKVHVNPNFTALAKKPSSIHVNPNIINVNFNNNNQKQKEVEKSTLTNLENKTKPLLATKTKLIRAVAIPSSTSSTTTKNLLTVNANVSAKKNSLHLNKFKLVNNNNNRVVINNNNNKTSSSSCSPLVRRRKLSFHSKYKIVRKEVSSSTSATSSVIKKKSSPVKSQFKLDRRKLIPIKTPMKRKLCNESVASRKVVRNGELKSKLVTIKGLYSTLYKKQHLVARNLINHIQTKNKTLKMITIAGQRYKMGKNQRTLKKADISKINSSNSSIVKKKSLRVLNASGKRSRASSVSLVKISKNGVNTSISKLRKSNIACPYFKKYGRCRNKENGKCIRVHDPNQITICPRFLQGACVNEKCLLSHKVLPEKMPTCKFFLEGMCSKNDCQYLHVKINPKAEICKDFLEGYCAKAAECTNRHQYLCPEFELGKSCPRVRCPFPHGSRVRDICLTTVAKKFKIPNNTKKTKTSENENNNKIENKKDETEDCDDDDNLNSKLQNTNSKRYYGNNADDGLEKSELVKIKRNSKEFDEDDDELNKRPKLGTLPSFIPFS